MLNITSFSPSLSLSLSLSSDEYDLVEAQRLLDESKEVEEGGAGDETLIKGKVSL